MSSTLLRTSPALRSALRARALKPAAVAASTQFVRGKATLPDLPYDYGALEPYISGKIMELHHSKHHQTYVNGLNSALDSIAEAESKGDLTKAAGVAPLLNFHGGGHVNHSLFWENLAPASQNGGGEPDGELKNAIDTDFGSFDTLRKQTNAALAGIQGSGWAWLVKDKESGTLGLVTRANQDPVTGSLVPLLGIDAWEHAYYLQYQNRKAEYFDAIWNVINWKTVAERFSKA
ncbi:putative superoxide dismutase protein [Phaeoacremonium minimum UCRPA7]|uniref:Superoxide dismutase n=1 Tax=Phaeoacremonium minimum (strain UCR-PA7) TaxID=1286976 RepID=R8B8L0_PHAM7|nr:putative superoxide dismutase protein [Phaeoacremonium minimum UCRPA7]EON95645.1 putative superoxide dismutase protein [Phaeoacremonium minimum UCRPA7]